MQIYLLILIKMDSKMPNIANHSFNFSQHAKTTEDIQEAESLYEDFDFNEAIDSILVEPLLSGKAYHVDIKDFTPLEASPFLSCCDEMGLNNEIQKGYINEYNILFKPYIVHFEFRYDYDFLKKLKELFAKMSSNRYDDSIIWQVKDLRKFDMSCVVFGDFDLTYIEKEGWYGIKQFYLDTFQCIRLEYSKLLAQKLNKMSSYLYFSFLDSANQHIVGAYSDFRDYSLTLYNTKISRKMSKILVNTNRATFATYQVEPLSPIALSYRLRLFFLLREKPEENLYTFAIFLSDDEAKRITNVRAWANSEI